MSGSLIIGDWDVLAAGSPLMLAWDGGRNLGDPVPDTQTVSRILLDGDVVSGVRSANREIVLKLFIKRLAVAQAAAIRSRLFQVVNQQQWTMQWTPDDGMTPVLFDCFRGTVQRTWEETYDSTLDVLVVTIPALPFTRDAAPTVLAPPATMPVPLVLHTMESTTGLTAAPYWANPYTLAEYKAESETYWVAINGKFYPFQRTWQDYGPDPAVAVDAMPAQQAADTSTFVVGSSSVRVEQPVIWAAGVDEFATAYQHGYAPVTVTIPLTPAVDLSSYQVLQWWARADQTLPDGQPSGIRDPRLVGINVADQDSEGVSSFLMADNARAWVATLVDSAGKTGTWLLNTATGSTWQQFQITLSSPVAVDDGFNLASISKVRLRYYIVGIPAGNTSGLTALPTYELSGVPSDEITVNTGASTAVSSVSYTTTDAEKRATIIPTSGATDVTAALNYSFSLTAGTYYADLIVQSAADMTGVTATLYINSTAGVPVEFVKLDSYVGYPMADVPVWQARATAAITLAATTSCSLKVRLQSAAAVPGFTIWGPRAHSAGDESWAVPYPAAAGFSPASNAVRMWFDQVEAAGSGHGMHLSQPYGLVEFDNIEGDGRTPVSIEVAASSTFTNALLMRVPNPRAGFTPFLDAPTSSTVTDAAALSGKPGVCYSGHNATWTVPAGAYRGTYAVMVRLKFHSIASLIPVTLTASIGADTLTSTVTSNLNFLGISGYVWVTLGVMTLPPHAVAAGNTETMTLTMSTTSSSATSSAPISVDLIVLADLSGEALMLSGAPASSRLWLDSPDSDDFVGTAWIGSEDTRLDAVSAAPWQQGQAIMNFDPGSNLIAAVIDDSPTADVTLTYSPRWAGEHP